MESGDYQLEDLELLEGAWDLQERLAAAFAEARLPAFFPDKRAAELSGGELVRALLCAAFIADADYVLLDEPTNHLDRQARTWFYDKLTQRRGGALVATHDRELLAMMPRILELTPTALSNYGGNYADYHRQRQAEQQAAQAALEHATTERRRTRMRLQKEHDASQRRSGTDPTHGRFTEYRLI